MLSKGSFEFVDNDVNFLCHQIWGAWLPVLLFTLDDKDRIMHFCCCQWNLFLMS